MQNNTHWHSKHKLPQNPTLDHRIKFHLEHARRCPCALQDEDILEELQKRYLGKHQDFWIEHNTNDHRALGAWAADCAEHLLPYFEGEYPEDTRPRDSIKILREWVKTGKFSMPLIRKASLGAHSAAKKVNKKDIVANYADHAAGQAVGTAHVPTNSLGVVLYSVRLIAFLHPTNAKEAISKERAWQTKHLLQNLKPWVDAWVDKTFLLLPKQTREQLS